MTVSINLKNIFENGENINYKLKGIIFYYGRHYNACFFNNLIKKWLVIDDTIVKQVTIFFK